MKCAKKSLISKEFEQLMEAYCVKCKAKTEVKNPVSITMKNGKPAISGVCATCGTKVFKIGAAK
jgi:hypothetical protein